MLGGPRRYSRECADQSFLLHLHAGNGEMGDLGRRFVEWAVEDVLAYSPEDAVLPSGLPVPRWSWDGLQTA